MRVLFLTSRLPYPPDRGDRLRVFNFLKNLSKTGHVIHLLSFIAQEEEKRYINELQKYCEEIRTVLLPATISKLKAGFGLLNNLPLQVSYYKSSRMQSELNTLINKNCYDILYVHLFRMAPYVLNYKDIYKILDLTDVVSKEIELSIPYRSGIKRKIYKLEFPRIRRYETEISGKVQEVWLISEQEAKLLRSYSPHSKIEVVTNGVDTDYFRPLELKKDPFSLIFVGNLQIDHNVDAILYFYESIFPLIRENLPQTKFYIVGASPNSRLRSLSKDNNVIITGLVDDLNLYLNQADIFISPLRFSAGIQNKILQAMSAGLPVVCSPLVNQGIEADPGREILVEKNPLHFAEQVIYLMRNPDRRKVIGLNARQFVKNKFQWENVTRRFQILEEEFKKR
jgi:sugar transferase (PEP-CTERM/EpsH1 system associated)